MRDNRVGKETHTLIFPPNSTSSSGRTLRCPTSQPRDIISPVGPGSTPGSPPRCASLITPHLGDVQEACWPDTRTTSTGCSQHGGAAVLPSSSQMSALFALYLRLSPGTLWRKPLSAAYIYDCIHYPKIILIAEGFKHRSASTFSFQPFACKPSLLLYPDCCSVGSWSLEHFCQSHAFLWAKRRRQHLLTDQRLSHEAK